jgi:hypothetical protein
MVADEDQRALAAHVRSLFRSAHGFVALGPRARRLGASPSDLRWSRDGAALAVCAAELVVAARTTDVHAAILTTDNAAGTIRFRPIQVEQDGSSGASLDKALAGENPSRSRPGYGTVIPPAEPVMTGSPHG